MKVPLIIVLRAVESKFGPPMIPALTLMAKGLDSIAKVTRLTSSVVT